MKMYKRRILSMLMIVAMILGLVNGLPTNTNSVFADDTKTELEGVGISYKVQVQSFGWEKTYVSNGATSGTVGKAKRLEGIKIKLIDAGGNKLSESLGSVKYKTHIEKRGWESEFAKNDELSGTVGKALRLEAIQIKLSGTVSELYDVYYRVQAEKFGWLGWAKNGEDSGTAGFAYRLEAIQIKLVDKDDTESIPTSNLKAFYKKSSIATVSYKTQVQSFGWEKSFVSNGATSGTVGKAKRLEAIKIYISKNPLKLKGSIKYKTHVQKKGWQDYVSDGELSGTVGKALRLEAIRIKLTGDLAKTFDVYYRVQAQKLGWMGWAKNGESAGSAGFAYRLEAIQIQLVYKGTAAPGSTKNAFFSKNGKDLPADENVDDDSEDNNKTDESDDKDDEEVVYSDLENANVGEYVTFGSYEQDNDLTNGKEAIEWKVLDKDEDGNLFVISRYGLDCKRYTDGDYFVTWEICTLRAWLNNEFYNDAFDDSEKNMIPTTHVINDGHPKFNINGGNDTDDKIFLLSIDEALKYFKNNDENTESPYCQNSIERFATSTVYANAQGVICTEEDSEEDKVYNNGCWWHLRSPGDGAYNSAGNYVDETNNLGYSCRNACINERGGIDNYGGYTSSNYGFAVRPVLWINPKSDTSDQNESQDGKDKTDEDSDEVVYSDLENANVGEYVTFGSYEQDNDLTNGKEAIEWKVLDKDEDGNLFVISRYGLDGKSYNEENVDVTWETCTLRAWLNNEFYDETFGNKEKNKILTTHVVNDDNSRFGTEGGNDTEDKIFLLSTEEALKYFKNNDEEAESPYPQDSIERFTTPTKYAQAQGVWAHTFDGEYMVYDGGCYWWLRSPGCESNCANCVGYTGSVDELGSGVYNDGGVSGYGYDICSRDAVRPALWINPNA